MQYNPIPFLKERVHEWDDIRDRVTEISLGSYEIRVGYYYLLLSQSH
ncbi:MAG: hypothetical protein ACFFB2_01630 [Promethearchaeota archaeon]